VRVASLPGTFLRRHFEPVMLSVQVLVDLCVVLLCCWLGYLYGAHVDAIDTASDYALRTEQMYRELSALVAAVCLVTFHAFGMYSPVKSLLNMEEFKAVAKSTVISFLVLVMMVIYLQRTRQDPEGTIYGWLVPVHKWIDLDVNITTISRLTLLVTFVLILVLMTASRFASFKVIQVLHQRGIGNRNVLIYGAGETGKRLQRKFMLVPTLGLNLIGFADDDKEKVGEKIERCNVLGSFDDLPRLIGQHKISEVFVAMPEAPEERVMRVLAELERQGVTTRMVPRFHHLMSFKVRIETLDSIPLITRADTRPSLLGQVTKRLLDLFLAGLVIVVTAPVFLLIAILIKRESKGPVFFVQQRVGRDGKPFRMIKFRTMHAHMSGDAPTPRTHGDPRITPTGRWLRRFSLDELPQFLNVLVGDMSIVGPRPEMRFIVDQYGPLDRERLRAKPGITGLWQISYARQMAIHDNLDYDLYYIEHQSFLLDLVIIALTAFAVVKGTGAY
jgi:exopolysaccharide biosynthesis polyprenyl glycosylphosphotransferase